MTLLICCSHSFSFLDIQFRLDHFIESIICCILLLKYNVIVKCDLFECSDCGYIYYHACQTITRTILINL